MTNFRSSGPVSELDQHVHNVQQTFGIASPQTATNWGTINTITPYQVASGDNTWGAAVQVLGTGDTPVLPNKLKFDTGKMYVDNVSTDTIYRIRLIFGEDTSAAAINAKQYSEGVFKFDTIAPATVSAGNPIYILMPKLRVSAFKIWAQVWNVTNGATLKFFVELHEY